MKLSEKLKAAKSKIDSPEKWTQGVLHRNRFGDSCHEYMACSHCSIGALKVANGIARLYDSIDILEEIIAEQYFDSKWSSLEDFNDNMEHSDVMQVFDKAIALAEKREFESMCHTL